VHNNRTRYFRNKILFINIVIKDIGIELMYKYTLKLKARPKTIHNSENDKIVW